MLALTPFDLNSVAVIGASCGDIAVGVGATLMEIANDKPDLVVHALVLTGGGTDREVEEKNAFITLCPSADVRLTVADLPGGQLQDHRRRVKQLLSDFRRDCEPDMVFGPPSSDRDEDHRFLAELIPTEFRDHLVLGYEILAPDSDLPSPSLYLPIPTETAREGEAAHPVLSVPVSPTVVRRRGIRRVDASPWGAVQGALRRGFRRGKRRVGFRT